MVVKISMLLLLITFSLQAQISPAVAANMKFAFEEIREQFTKKTGYIVTPVYGASGKLVTQIRTGAPFDLFISADVAFADSIIASKLNSGNSAIYAYGKLVLWSCKNINIKKGITVLTDLSIKTIALGDLRQTVYGPAAKKMLEAAGLWESVEPKVVYGESITKVTQFIATGNADIGLTAKSLVLADEMKSRGTWIEIDSSEYESLPQAAVMLHHGEVNNKNITIQLFNFLFSKEAQDILLKYGYALP